MDTLTPPDARGELEALIRSRIPLIVIETRDEPRVLKMLREITARLTIPQKMPLFDWTVTDGLRRIDIDFGGAQKFNAEASEVLKSIRATDKAGVYVLLDFHPYLEDPVNVRLLKDICLGYDKVARTVVLVSCELNVPRELDAYVAHFKLTLPDSSERRLIIEQIAGEWTKAHGTRVRYDQKALESLVENLSGLSTADAERLARKAIFNDGALQPTDLPGVMQAKYELLNRNGVLSLEYDTARFADLGGMARLKAWAQQRQPAFTAVDPQLDPPKGVLLLGVQGCGKSIAARALAGIFGVPLLRLDFAAIHNKYIGESERNLRETLTTADAMAPAVLWIDEIEKAIAAGDSDGGTSRRVLGEFLTWLAEKRTRVFVVATANDISALPPELIRKGRFDEIFFVDLPTDAIRADILRIHATKRGINLPAEVIPPLVAASSGFSGAEIEQAVVSALYAARSAQQPPDARYVMRELHATRPLSIVMAERVAELRAWAAERTVAAD